MNRVLKDLPWMLGILIIGLLVGSYIGQSSGLWWLIVALAVVAIVSGVVSTLHRRRIDLARAS